jgi:hypothetical protein
VGNLYDYFAAAADEEATATLDLAGGPGGVLPDDPELIAALRSGDREAIERLSAPQLRRSEHGFDVLSAKGIEPVVQMGTLERLLDGLGPDAVAARTRSGNVIGHTEASLVVTLSDESWPEPPRPTIVGSTVGSASDG